MPQSPYNILQPSNLSNLWPCLKKGVGRGTALVCETGPSAWGICDRKLPLSFFFFFFLRIIIIILCEPQPLLVCRGAEMGLFIESLLVAHLWFHSPSLKALFKRQLRFCFILHHKVWMNVRRSHTKGIWNELCSQHNCCIVQGFQLTPFCFPVMQSEVHSFQIPDPDCLLEVLLPLLTRSLQTENWVAETTPQDPKVFLPWRKKIHFFF